MQQQEPEQDQEANSFSDRLNKWYSNVNPRYIDLVGDFGGRELFIIDGDSLLFSFFLDPKTHWLNVTDPMGGGQFLALTFLFETFLKNLLDRSCNFNLVFFEAHKVIWAENSKLLVLRHAIIEHLKEKAKLIELLQFDNWWGTEWQEYLDAWQPLFVLLGDGTTENSYSSESLLTEDTILSNSIKNISVRLGCFCQAFMFFCIRKDISIALIPSIRFQDSRVFAFVFDRIGNMIKNPRFVDEMTKFLEIWCKDFSVHASNLDSEDLVTKLLTNESYKQVLRKGNQRMFFIILSMIPIVRKQQFPQKIIEIFVYHAVLLDYLPLQLRAQKALNSTSPIIISFLEEFYKECAHLLIGKDWRHVVNSLQLECNIGDFIDTRLFGILCALSDCDLVFPVEVERIAKLMLNMVKSLSQSYNSMSSQSTDDIKEPLAIIKSAAQIINPTDEISLLSFQFPFFDKYLGDMNLNLRKAPEKVENIDYGLYGLEGNFKFLEIYHWHILKPLEKKAFSKGKPWDEASARKFKQRSTQKYIYFMQRYSDSLGSKHNQLIITDRSISKKKLVSNASETRSPQTLMKETKVIEKQAKKKEKEARKASKVSEKAQAIRDEKKKKELENAEAESRRNMEKFNQEISTLKTTKSKLNRLSEFIRSSGKLKHPPTMMGAQLLDLQLQLQLWAEEMKTNGNNPDFSKAIDIYRQVFNIFYKFSEILTSQVVEILDEVLVRLGLENSALKIREFRTINSNSSTPYSFQFPLKSIKLSVNLSDARFQLKYGGHSMDHDTNSVYDSRVKTFKPDDWQVEVLNVIDRKESALVCCPTSSGKTFIAFYAMEQVLREDDDGIIVYVAPTKPLVNQITAEVYGRFKKNYPENSGMSHWGIYTREYRENHDCCQILITVPEMLEILMLSPIRSDDWVPKIRRIIFDEIHSIGEADNGIVWEHLLLVAQCPILALSATVGNPEEFSSWIEKAQKLRGKKMHLIQTDKRYSELVKFAYIPSLPFPTFTTVGPEVANSFVRVHPCSALSPIMLRKKGFPKDMKILPDECLNLYDKMRQISGKNESKILNRLNPDNWFRKMIPIRKADTNEYEKEIKEYFRLWAIEDSTIPAVKQIINDFKSPINEQFSKLEASAIQEKDFDAKHNVYDNNFLECSIIHLASELNSQNKLPAIFFHFDRHGCIHLASKILEKLELYETQTRENDMDYQKRKREAIARTNAKEKMTKKGSEGKKKVGRGKSDNWDDNETSIPEDSPEIFDWEKHDPRFTFAHIQSNVSKQELEALLKYSQKQMKGNNIFLLRALERGIAVHHGGMPKKYLQAVEILFRQKYVRIVIATGTLALGINMPCKTVVFCGDSVFLTALNYRQMAGRSGRRGFDLVGNVIFFGLTWTKISRLLISDLPKLNGSFPMTTTLALRSFLLLTQTKNLINAEEAIKGLLGQTFFCLGREHLSDQIKHHLIFSIQYLMRENLLDKNGQLLNLAGAVTHLHYTEPSNFAFVVLYKHGVWHKICRDVETNSKDVMDMLMLVLSNLFNIIPIRRLGKAWISTLRKKYPSRIVLDPIPTSVQQILDMHNDRVIKIYSTYVITFAQNIIELDDKLPLSNMRFPFEYIDLNGELLSQLKSTCVPYVARSSFMAICSGQGDLFRNIYDLTSHLRSSIFLEARSVPFIDTDRYLNAYLFDFFLHGQQKALIEANGIRGGEIWKFLKDFSYILNAICVSLNTLDGVDENVLKGFKLVREEFEAKFQSIWA